MTDESVFDLGDPAYTPIASRASTQVMQQLYGSRPPARPAYRDDGDDVIAMRLSDSRRSTEE